MDINNIKKKKLEELQRKFVEQQEEELKERAQLQQDIATLETIAKQHMTKEAISRYGNVKLAHPEKAIQALVMIVQGVQAGQINEKVDDSRFKMLLQSLIETKKETKIRKI